MKLKKVNIATARINGLTSPPFYFQHRDYYVCGIIFTDASTLQLSSMPVIKVGVTEKEGKVFWNQVIENFKQAHIHEGERVVVIFEDDGSIIAIGNTEGKDAWIDTNDKFTKKTFIELNIVIKSLKVY